MRRARLDQPRVLDRDRALVGEGGPVPLTRKQVVADFVCALTLKGESKVASMRKVWNAPWSLKALGWA